MTKKNSCIRLNDVLTYVSIFVAVLCATNGELSATKNTIIYYLPYVCCFVALMFELFIVRDVKIHSYIIWRLLVLSLFIITFLYALNFDSAFFAIKKYTLQTVVTFLICVKCTLQDKSIGTILKVFVFAICINLIYACSTMDIAALAEGQRLGASSLNSSWNANEIGITAALGILLSFLCFHILNEKRRPLSRVIMFLLFAFFGFAVLISGSRKAFLVVVVASFIYLIFKDGKIRVKGVLCALALLTVILYALKNFDFLYNTVGYRFDSFFALITDEGVADNSSIIRQNMISVGISAFFDNPIFGYGINCFKEIYGSITGNYVYAHNNFVELLVDVGIVGFVLYYGYLIKVLLAKAHRDKKALFLKAMLVAMLLIDYGLVSYYSEFYQYVLVIILLYIPKFSKAEGKPC